MRRHLRPPLDGPLLVAPRDLRRSVQRLVDGAAAAIPGPLQERRISPRRQITGDKRASAERTPIFSTDSSTIDRPAGAFFPCLASEKIGSTVGHALEGKSPVGIVLEQGTFRSRDNMGHFDKALKYAESAGGRAIKFKQAKPVCIAHSMRWMIGQLMGREFDAGAPPFRESRDFITFEEIKAMSDKKVIRRMTETDERRKKADNLFRRLDKIDTRPGEIHLEAATRKHLSEKFGQAVQVDDMGGLEGIQVKAGLESIPRQLRIGGTYGYMISLRTESNVASRNDFTHAVAAYSRPGSISFFDPNMGEVMVAPDVFERWFGVYHEAWKHAGAMRKINMIRYYQVRAPADVEKYVKSLKRDAERKFLETAKEYDALNFDDFHSLAENTFTIAEKDALETKAGDDEADHEAFMKSLLSGLDFDFS